MTDMATKQAIQALKAYTTCDVADALLKLKHPHGGFLSNLTLWSPHRQEGSTKIVGPAYTVKYARHADATGPKVSGHYIDSVPEGAVLFISAPSGLVNAVYGGLMTARAKYRGVVGTVVDGRIRDLQEHRDEGFPVFARDVGTTAPQEVVRVVEVGGSVTLQSTEQEAVVETGDVVMGDLNGVVCIPARLVGEVVRLIPSQVEADERVKKDIEGGRSVVEAMKEHRSKVLQPENV